VTAALYSQGNDISRNARYAPFNQQWDMSLQRSFVIHERHAIDFRAESFNVFNHGLTNQPSTATQPSHFVNASLANGAFASPTLGTTTFLDYGLTNSGGRTLRFLLKYSF
jgi:hypothetical protein